MNNFEKQEKFVPEECRGDVLEKISAVIERVGKENLEQPEVKQEIETILEDLLNKARLEEKINLELYKLEMVGTVETARKSWEKEQEELGLSILDAEKKPEDIAQERIDSLEKSEPKPLVKDYTIPEETKTKALLGKAGGIFKNSSVLRKWAGILSLSILFHGGLFFGLKKFEEKGERVRAEEVLRPPSAREIMAVQKTIEMEKFKEFNQNYLNWDLNELSEICEKIKYIHQQYPETQTNQKIGYILESEQEEINRLFDQIEINFQEQGVPWFEDKTEMKAVADEWTAAIQFLDEKIKFEEADSLELPRYLCSSTVDYVMAGQGQKIENYYQITLTIIDSENSAIVDQLSLKLDPKMVQEEGCAEAIQKEIVKRVQESIKQKAIEQLPPASAIEQLPPPIVLNQEKYQQFSPAEKELYKKGIELVNDLWVDFIIENPEGYSRLTITPRKEVFKTGPIKIDGKIGSLSFSLPKDYQLVLNGQKADIGNPEGEKVYYTFDNYFIYKGSVGAPSQEKELVFSILDKNGKEVGRFFLEQVPEWFVENVYYQNSQDKPDSIGIYITDADTLKIYQQYSKELSSEAMKNFIQGTLDVEKYFKIDIDIQKARIGSDIEEGNAYYFPEQEKAINLLAPMIVQLRELAPNEKIWAKDLELTGRHESLHKLDASLGEGEEGQVWKNLSDAQELLVFFNQRRGEWNAMTDEQKAKSLIYLIKEGNFYDELNEANFGHPEDNTAEFFASILNTAMAEQKKLKIEFQKWPDDVKQQYVEGLIIVEKLLHEKNVNTDNLSELIKYLIDLRAEKTK